MNPLQTAPIPLTILAGFLGAGKTTLLNHILNGEHGLRVAVLVNDFGAINIDTQLIVGVAAERVTLSNGCICCSIRDDLLSAVLSLLELPDKPEYLIIEASGVSDPVGVAQTFLLPEVRNQIQLDSIITVVDAEQLAGLRGKNSVLALDQIGVADIIILNKIDLVTAEQRAAIQRDWIGEVAPKARVWETSYCQIPLELLLNVGYYDPLNASRPLKDVHVHEAGAHHHDHDHDHSLLFESWSWANESPLSLKKLRRVISALPISIFRAKGLLYLADDPARQAILQVVGERVNLTWGAAWGDERPYSQLVFIGQPQSLDPAQLSVLLADTEAERGGTEFENLKGRVLGWLRTGR